MRYLAIVLISCFSLLSLGAFAEPLPLAFPNLFNADVTRDKLSETQSYIEQHVKRPIELEILNSQTQLQAYCGKGKRGLIIWPEVHFDRQACNEYRLLMVADFSLNLYHYRRQREHPQELVASDLVAQAKRIGLIRHTRASDLTLAHFKGQTQVELVWFSNYYQAFKALLAKDVDLVAAANILPAALGGFWQTRLQSVYRFEQLSRTGLYIHQSEPAEVSRILLARLDGSKISAADRARINLGVTSYKPVTYNAAPENAK